MDYGWTDYIDQRGKPCAYCGEPSTETLVLEPDEYKNKELVRRGKRVGVCDAHTRNPEGVAPAISFRRRKAKGVEQLSIDVGDGHRPGPRSAIHGGEAA